MDATTTAAVTQSNRHPLWVKLLLGLAVLLAALVLLVIFFPWSGRV